LLQITSDRNLSQFSLTPMGVIITIRSDVTLGPMGPIITTLSDVILWPMGHNPRSSSRADVAYVRLRVGEERVTRRRAGIV
jgi:hypothetical protein